MNELEAQRIMAAEVFGIIPKQAVPVVPAAPPSWLDSVLPTAPVMASLVNPRSLIIYSDLKVGKSTLCSWLSLNEQALWLDLEDGSEALPGLKVNVMRTVVELQKTDKNMSRAKFLLKLCGELAANKPPRFRFLLVDKLDTLEDWADKWATAEYKRSVTGQNFTESTVKLLPKFFGYTLIQEKFKELWAALSSAAPHVIFFGTLRTTRETGDNNQQGAAQGFVHSTDIDLTGKLRKLTVGDADAIGFLYREPVDGANYLSFASKEKGAFCGNRIPRLEGRKFKLSWQEGAERKLTVAWREIFV